MKVMTKIINHVDFVCLGFSMCLTYKDQYVLQSIAILGVTFGGHFKNSNQSLFSAYLRHWFT